MEEKGKVVILALAVLAIAAFAGYRKAQSMAVPQPKPRAPRPTPVRKYKGPVDPVRAAQFERALSGEGPKADDRVH